MNEAKEKILVLGAGLAGLYSAYLLKEQGYDVTVLEARDRLGGRTFTDEGVDLGGQWVSSLHPRLMKLCQQFGLSLYRQFEEGIFIRYFNQKREELQEKHNILKPNQVSTMLATYIEKFYELMNQDDFFAQQKHLDEVSFYDWCRENISDEMAFKTFDYSFSMNICVDSRFASMFFWLYFLKACGGYRALVSIKDGAQEFRIEGGIKTLADKLANNLNIIHNAEVIAIKKQQGVYQVQTKGQRVYSANKVVCTLPTQLIPKINWTPALEKERMAFYQSLKMGSVTKVVLQYETAFWREEGYNAQIISDTPPVYLCYDASNSKYHAVVVFIVEDLGYTDQQITDQLTFLLNNDLAKSPKKIYRKNWSEDPFSGGCYFCVPPVGSLAKNLHYFTKPFGNIYFAGTETASHWMGYMEGALESAERVMKQIINVS